MGLRLAMRKVRHQAFELGDYLTILAIVYVCNRTALVSVILTWGTTNSPQKSPSEALTPHMTYQISLASKLALANRGVTNT